MTVPYSSNSVTAAAASGGGGSSTSSGAANVIQVSDGSGGFSNNSGDTATSSAYTINTSTLVADKSKSIIGINKTPTDYALEIDGSARPIGATLSATDGSSMLLFDNNGLQVSSADLQVSAGDITCSFGNLQIGGIMKTNTTNTNLIVGTSSREANASAKLEILGDCWVNSSTGSYYRMYYNNAGTDYELATIGSLYAPTTDSSALSIKTRIGGSVLTRMYFKEDDRIGVGTTTPSASFHTNKHNSSDPVLESSGTGTTETALKIETAATSGSGVVFDLGGSTNQFVALNSGNIGVGQSNPTQKLHVGKSADTDAQILVENSGGNIQIGHSSATRFGLAAGSNIAEASGAAFGIGTQSNHKVVLGTNNSERLVILGTGNIGVGQSNPTHKLEVNGAVALGNINVSGAHTDLGLMSSTTLSINASGYTYRTFIVSTNGNNIQTITPSNFNVNTQVVIYIYCTQNGSTLYGSTSTLSGTKSAHGDIVLTVGDTAILTLTYDGTNYFASAVKFQ